MDLNNLKFWGKTDREGKPGTEVFYHLLNVGYVAKELNKLFPNLHKIIGLNSNQLALYASLHDIGKIIPGFQSKCKKWIEQNRLSEVSKQENWDLFEKNHSKGTQYILEQYFRSVFEKNQLKPSQSHYLASALASHHGKILNLNSRPVDKPNGVDYWKEEIQKTMEALFKEFVEFQPLDIENPINSSKIWYIAGLTTIADWIGSDENYFPSDKNLGREEIQKMAKNALENIGIKELIIHQNLGFQDIFENEPYDMQKQAIKIIKEPGIYIVEAPMGMGKTEAALGAAYTLLKNGLANGIYFALPTQVTSNRIYLRVQDFLKRICVEDPKIKLIHGNSWLLEKDLAFPEILDTEKNLEVKEEIRDWFDSSKRALISTFGVGTVDQALLGVVAAKHFFVRQFALAGKVVILDEVHSYDIYTGTLISVLCKRLVELGATVIVLSATLTKKRRNEIMGIEESKKDSYPLISGQTRLNEILEPVAPEPPKNREFQIFFKKKDSVLEEAIEKAKTGACVLWVCNTIDSAQSVYLSLEEQNPEFKIGLLHSCFPFFRREKQEEQWINYLGKNNSSREGCILVSTQIVEQSIDIDADLLITELAPTDMLFQRMGRAWRHNRSDRKVKQPEYWIIKENFTLDDSKKLSGKEIQKLLGAKACVYHPYVLLRSLQVWNHKNKIQLPYDIRTLLEETYTDLENEPVGWKELKIDLIEKKQEMENKARLNANVWSQLALSDEEGVQTRIIKNDQISLLLFLEESDHSFTLLDGSKIAKREDQLTREEVKSIHRNLVKTPKWVYDFKKWVCFQYSKSVHGGLLMGNVLENAKIILNGVKDGIDLEYRDNLGVYKKNGSYENNEEG